MRRTIHRIVDPLSVGLLPFARHGTAPRNGAVPWREFFQRVSANAAIHARDEFQLIATSFVDQDPISSM